MTGYFNRIHEGLPIDDVEIIDMHTHAGPYYDLHIPSCSTDDVVKNMDRAWINKAVFSPTAGLASDIVFGNNTMLDGIKRHRGRLYGAVAVNGNYPELSVEELERCFAADKDVVMVKAVPVLSKCKLDDKRMKGIYEFASQRKLFFLVHSWLDNEPYGSQDLLAGVAKDYPDIRFIMAHTGGPYGSVHAVELAGEIPNIFLEIALSFSPARHIEFLVSEIGSERVLFGTDNPYIDPRPQIGRIFLADISHEDRLNILNVNPRRYIDFD